MNHLETLTAEWLSYNGYFTRTAVKVGKRDKGGWDGELDVIGFHPDPDRRHFLHIECSTDAWTWAKREETFQRKFRIGRKHALEYFQGMASPDELKNVDQVVVHGFAGATDKHRKLGGGRLVRVQELVAEIMNGIPPQLSISAVPENYPLMRTLQLSVMAGAKVASPKLCLIPIIDDKGITATVL